MGGFLHRMDGETWQQTRNLPPPEETPVINVPEIMDGITRTSPSWRVEALAKELGVAAAALFSLGCVWSASHNAYAIPEFDSGGNAVGICLRYPDGKKLQVKGSHRGLYVPDCQCQSTLHVAEGFSDTAAGLTLGFYTVGRPSCSGGVQQLCEFIQRNRFSRAVIVSDLDDPGIRGAQTLQEHLPIPSCLLIPVAKDLREFVQVGGTRELIESMVSNLIWFQPQPQKGKGEHTQQSR